MIKNRLKIAILTTALLTTSLFAENSGYQYDAKSLVAIEGGYDSFSTETSSNSSYSSTQDGQGHIGLKIGAQSGNYRVFLSARYYVDPQSKYDYVTSYGIEGQYLFKIMPAADFFVGLNGGLTNMKFKIAGENFSRTISDPYYGGDIGLNFHITKGVDFELGTRYMSMDSSNIKNNITYRFNSIVTAYSSIIFKYKMD